MIKIVQEASTVKYCQLVHGDTFKFTHESSDIYMKISEPGKGFRELNLVTGKFLDNQPSIPYSYDFDKVIPVTCTLTYKNA